MALRSFAQQKKIWIGLVTAEMQRQAEAAGTVLPAIQSFDQNGRAFPQTANTASLRPILPQPITSGIPRK